MRMKYFTIGIVTLAVASGCTTTLESESVAQDKAAGRGVLYNLPRTVFDVEAKFLVSGCSVTKQNTDSFARLTYELTSAAVSTRLVGDPSETYRVRYDKLNAPTKITSAGIVMHGNGMIKSVNISQDDRTSQVISALSATAINLVKISTIGFGAASGVAKVGQECDSILEEKLATRSKLIASLEDLRKADAETDKANAAAAKKAAADLDAATKKLDEAKKASNASEVAALQKNVDQLSEASRKAIDAASEKSKQAATAQTALDKLTGELTATARLIGWSPSPSATSQIYCSTIELSQTDYRKSLSVVPPTTAYDEAAQFKAQACLDGLDKSLRTRPIAIDQPGTEAAADGIFYRLPAIASVVVKQDAITLVGATSVSVPQFGAKAILWLENKPFDQNTLEVAFNEDGSLSSLTFKALAASAERAATSIVDTSKSLVELMQIRADAAKAKAQAAEAAQKADFQKQIDALDQQVALVNKRNELESARTPTSDALDREKTQLTKQIDVERLRQEYNDLIKKGSSQ